MEIEVECPVCGGSGFSVAGIGHPCFVCEGTGVINEEEEEYALERNCEVKEIKK